VLSERSQWIALSFNPRTDVGSLLATTAKPVSLAAEPNEYLRGLQFDVNVLSFPQPGGADFADAEYSSGR